MNKLSYLICGIACGTALTLLLSRSQRKSKPTSLPVRVGKKGLEQRVAELLKTEFEEPVLHLEEAKCSLLSARSVFDRIRTRLEEFGFHIRENSKLYEEVEALTDESLSEAAKWVSNGCQNASERWMEAYLELGYALERAGGEYNRLATALDSLFQELEDCARAQNRTEGPGMVAFYVNLASSLRSEAELYLEDARILLQQTDTIEALLNEANSWGELFISRMAHEPKPLRSHR